ncbi:MAG: asparagine synthase (glutamine-hydrolyzing) [Phycisphaerales bacterium]
MCGIAGIVRITLAADAAARRHALTRPHTDAIPETWLDILDASIRRRGPDGQGRFRDRAIRGDGAIIDVAIVHRRLAILDPACGAQPMVSQVARGDHASSPEFGLLPLPLLFNGKPHDAVSYRPLDPTGDLVATAFNGCIYNHRSLRTELQAFGHIFASDHSDTEVLLHGTRQWGERLHEYLDGMYAYAVWSRRDASLLLARDPAGEKPLYVAALEPGVCAFGSSPAGLLKVTHATGAPVTIDQSGLILWLKHGYWPRMPVAGLTEITPGTCHRFETDGPRHVSTTSRSAASTTAPFDAARVESLLDAAIDSRLDADVPIGCFLSGGVDSSIVAALAHRAMLRHGRRLRTFTVQMPDARMDETPFANAVAAHLGTDHAVLACRQTGAADLESLIAQLGLPFGDSSLLPTHWVSAAAREHVTVALGGDGGDELFAGYNRYFAQRAMHRLRVLNPALRALPAWSVRLLHGNLARVANAARNNGYHDILTIFRTPQLRELVPSRDLDAILRDAYAPRPVESDARHDDFAHYLPEDLMRKVDTAAMAVALEVRAPLLSRSLVDAALGAPLSAVEAGEGRKGLLRQVARHLVPPQAVDRRKQGFGVPVGRWFRSDFGGMRTLLRDRLGSREPFGPPSLGINIHLPKVRKLLDDHAAEHQDHGQRLYMLLVLSLWTDTLAKP